MSQLDFTAALGRLLSDSGLRRKFSADPGDAIRRLGAGPEEASSMLALDPSELEAQARTLLRKRLGEVRRLLPRTFARVGSSAEALFREHAESFWPQGHRRHVEDALRFTRFLAEREVRGLCRAEVNVLRFRLGGGRFSLHPVGDLFVKGRGRRALQILVRKADRSVAQFALYLGL